MGDVAPCATIYVNNLNEKIKKDGAFASRSRVAANPRRARDPARANLSSRRSSPTPPRDRDPRSRLEIRGTTRRPPRRPRCPPPLRAVILPPLHPLTRYRPLPPPPPPPRDPLRRLVHPRTICTIISSSLPELRKSLVAAFSQFGKIIDVVAAKTYKLRGQAWVVFDSVPAATAAMRAMNDFPFYDKPMRVSYARTKSDATAKLDGTFDPSARDPEVRAKRKAESQQQEREARAKKAENEKQGRGGAGAAASADPDAPPNEILFVQGLPGTERVPRRFLFLLRASEASKAFEARASVGSAFEAFFAGKRRERDPPVR